MAEQEAISVVVDHPWIDFDLGAEMRVLSFAINRPGFVHSRRILWREVRNADLTEEFDVQTALSKWLKARDRWDSVCFLTSRDVRKLHQAHVEVEGISAHCVATVGLSNAERVGARMEQGASRFGTINIAVRVDTPLSQTGLIEAMTIVSQARTAAVIEAGIELPAGRATGTGTDCIAVAAPDGSQNFSGLHTPTGEAIGRCAYDAVKTGVNEWVDEFL